MTNWSGEVTIADIGRNRIIRIANEEKNLLNPGVMSGISRELSRAKDDQDVFGVILTGTGSFFCGGLDVPAIQAGADPIEFATHLVALLKVFPNYPKPCVAVLNGNAVASGASLAASCDFVVGHQDVLVGTYEVSVGVWPMIAQVPLIKAIGVRAAMENIGSGEPFTATRAYEVGLLNRIVSDGEQMAVAIEWLDKAYRGHSVYGAGRPSAYEYDSMPVGDALDLSLNRFVAQF